MREQLIGQQLLSTQRILDEFLTYPVDETTEIDELSVGEETFAADGPDDGSLAEEVNLGLMDGLTVNQRFEEQPRSYFEEKVCMGHILYSHVCT